MTSIFEPRIHIFLDTGLVTILIGLLIASSLLAQCLKNTKYDFSYANAFLFLCTLASAVTALIGIDCLKFFIPVFIILSYWFSKLSKNKLIHPNVGLTLSITKKISVSILVLFAACLLIFSSAQVHYDYFHGLVPSIDISINKISPSSWLKNFDSTYWPIKTQTIVPSLDAIEMYYGGSINNALSVIFLSALMISVILEMRSGVFSTIACLFCFSIYLWDFAQTPRPHILVGLACCMLMLASRNLLIQVLSIVILILAKRDGLIILIIICTLQTVPIFSKWKNLSAFLNSTTYKKIIFTALASLALLLIYSFLQWIPIKGNTLFDIISKVIIGVNLSIFSSFSVQVACVLAIGFIFQLYLTRLANIPRISILVLASVFIYVLLAALVLLVLKQPNEGTINRKLVYFLMPCMLVFLSNNWNRHEKNNK